MFNFLKGVFGSKINVPDVPPPKVPKGTKEKPSTEGKPVQQEIFDQAVAYINQRLDASNWIMGIAIVALVICFITLFLQYLQFESVSFNDYSNKVKELNDQRYQFLENRIVNLEKMSTPSAGTK